MMTRDELIKILDFLPIAARRAELIQKIVQAQEAAGIETLSKFIEVVLVRPKPSLVPTITKEDTLGAFLKEVYDSGYKFVDCYDPEMLMDFCAPESGNRELRYDEMTEGQQRTVRLIQMKYRQWKKSQRDVV